MFPLGLAWHAGVTDNDLDRCCSQNLDLYLGLLVHVLMAPGKLGYSTLPASADIRIFWFPSITIANLHPGNVQRWSAKR